MFAKLGQELARAGEHSGAQGWAEPPWGPGPVSDKASWGAAWEVETTGVHHTAPVSVQNFSV